MRNKDQEQEVLTWIENVLGEKLPNGPYEDVLRDGVVLCKLINKISPNSVKKIQSKGTNFQLMENIQRYVYRARSCSSINLKSPLCFALTLFFPRQPSKWYLLLYLST